MAPDDTTARYPSSPSSTPSPSSAMSSGVLVQPEDGSSAVSGSSTENVAFASDTTLQNGNDMDTSESTSISRSASEHSSRTDAASSTQDRHRLKQRTRGKSNSLGEDPRGDTGAAALATLQSVPFVSYSSSSSSGLVSNQDPSKPGFGGSGGNAEEKNQQRQQQQLKQLPRTSKRRKARTLFRRWRSVSQRHTWLTPLIICLAVVSAYLVNPRPSNPLHKALFLSYPIETDLSETDGGNVIADPGYDTNDTTSYSEQSATVIPSLKRTMYGKGPADFAFVAFYTIFLSFTREFIMQRILRPIATSAALRPHLRSRAKQARFMEQAYTAIYFAVLGPFGLYVMRYQSPLWYFNTRAMYEGFPHRLHQAAFKAYYLIEASYWLQQMGVLLLMLEKPRKDFKELVAHHIITLALIGLSYRFHFTYMGLAVYITHDVSDFFLATSKILNYTSSSLLAPYFASFIVIWTYLRHYINLRILASVLTEFSSVGPFALDWQSQQYKCRLSQTIVFGLLASLQAINLFWLVLILRIALRFVKSSSGVGSDGGAGGRKGSGEIRDIRSDDEDEDEDEDGKDEMVDGDGNGDGGDGGDDENSASAARETLGGDGQDGDIEQKQKQKQEKSRDDAPQVLLNGSPFGASSTSADTVNAVNAANSNETPHQRRSSPRRKVL